ncbi:MAG: methyltransferase domain-containing protein [Acidobacteriota bacterium]
MTELEVFSDAIRTKSFGEGYNPTLIDRFGVWLSARQVHRQVPDFQGLRIGDFGCGYHAAFVRTVLDQVASATLADVSISPDLEAHPKVTAFRGAMPGVLTEVPSGTLDVVLCISALEHLWNPVQAIREFRRMLTPDGVCALNVPSWRGKRWLEYSAFKLELSPADEMNDHKNYFDVKDLWPLLVRGGFLPFDIACFRHKFGLNTFAVCRTPK